MLFSKRKPALPQGNSAHRDAAATGVRNKLLQLLVEADTEKTWLGRRVHGRKQLDDIAKILIRRNVQRRYWCPRNQVGRRIELPIQPAQIFALAKMKSE